MNHEHNRCAACGGEMHNYTPLGGRLPALGVCPEHGISYAKRNRA